ncbi:MAG: prepilin-type N-terminal cleavage/methylation domain-containing protein [Bacteroidia bacterium]
MKFLRNKYLKGNTIIEVLIALAITSFCASLAVIIYLNIQKSSLPFFKIKAVELCEIHMKETLEKKTFTEETYKDEEFTIKKSIAAHEAFNDCYVIRIVAFDVTKKKIYELETVVYGNK